MRYGQRIETLVGLAAWVVVATVPSACAEHVGQEQANVDPPAVADLSRPPSCDACFSNFSAQARACGQEQNSIYRRCDAAAESCLDAATSCIGLPPPSDTICDNAVYDFCANQQDVCYANADATTEQCNQSADANYNVCRQVCQ
jgi:hypothetical protein